MGKIKYIVIKLITNYTESHESYLIPQPLLHFGEGVQGTCLWKRDFLLKTRYFKSPLQVGEGI